MKRFMYEGAWSPGKRWPKRSDEPVVGRQGSGYSLKLAQIPRLEVGTLYEHGDGIETAADDREGVSPLRRNDFRSGETPPAQETY